MGGYSANRTRKILASVPVERNLADPCDIMVRVDLVGVRSEVSQTLTVGDTLDVVLVARDSIKSVVCRKGSVGEIVGTLAAFRGLAQLISCIDAGEVFTAHVEAASAVRCSVVVVRSQ